MKPTKTPQLLVFLARHCALGVGLGLLLLVLLFFTNAMGFRDLLTRSESWFEASILLVGGFMITFGSLSMGTAIFMLPKHTPEDRDGGRLARSRPGEKGGSFPRELRPVPVKSKPRKT